MPVMILTNQSTKSQVRDALQAGARGYVLKTASFAEVVSAIRAVYQKSYYLSYDFPNHRKKICPRAVMELLGKRINE